MYQFAIQTDHTYIHCQYDFCRCLKHPKFFDNLKVSGMYSDEEAKNTGNTSLLITDPIKSR